MVCDCARQIRSTGLLFFTFFPGLVVLNSLSRLDYRQAWVLWLRHTSVCPFEYVLSTCSLRDVRGLGFEPCNDPQVFGVGDGGCMDRALLMLGLLSA